MMMKLIVVMILTFSLGTTANTFSQQITLSVKRATLENVMQEVRKQSGYAFIFNSADLRKAKAVTASLNKASMEHTLSKIFEGQPFTFEVVDRSIVVRSKLPAKASTEQNSASIAVADIKGNVIDALGKPLAGVSIKVKGKNIRTSTNENGQFELKNLNDTDILIIQMLGFQSREVGLGGRNNLLITLQVSNTELDAVNVINTGYQTISKERSAGSYAKPDMDVLANRSTSMNILQRLDGLVPGLTVNNAPMGGVNASSPFLIRGLTTIGTSDPDFNTYRGASTNRNPLYVVDGIQMDDISNINPQDVGDITVLKDATAASIWGARASNGVIVITTKKGLNNERIKISYDAFYNHQGRPDLDYYKMLNSKQYIEAFETAFADPLYTSQYTWANVSGSLSTAGNGVAPHELIKYNELRGLINSSQARSSLDSLSRLDNRAQIRDLLYQNASIFNQSLSLSGGFQKYSFYGSLSHSGLKGNRPGEDNQSYKVNLRQDFTFNKHIRAYLISDVTNKVDKNQSNLFIEGGFYPYQLFRDDAGKAISMPYLVHFSDATRADMENRSRIGLDYVPLDEMGYGQDKAEGLNARLTGGLDIKLWQGLSFNGVYGFVRESNKMQNLLDEQSYTVRSEVVQFAVPQTNGAAPIYNLPATGGHYTLRNVGSKNWTVRNQLAYANSWREGNHDVNLLLGHEAQEQLITTNSSMVRGYNELLQSVALIDYARLSGTGVTNTVWPNSSSGISRLAAQAPLAVSENIVRFQSYYANMGYTFLKRYTVNAGWRIDESNLFGRDKSAQNRPVWSVGARWNLTQEQFMRSSDGWLKNLALRASYGITGNAPTPGTAASYDILVSATNTFLQGGRGLNLSTPANPKLTWERTKTINIGLDFALLDQSRITGTLDYYQKSTSDLIGNFEVNNLTGFSSIVGNMGDMENKGLEVSLNTKNIIQKDFRWSSSFVLGYNKNKITSLVSRTPIASGYQKVGMNYLTDYPALSLFAYNYAGLDNMGDPQVKLSDGTITKDVNGSETKPEDILHMGSYQPVWSGGLGNVFRYKTVSLAANLTYNLGHVMRRDANYFYSGRFDHDNVTLSGVRYNGNIHADFANRWQKAGDEAITDIPAYMANISTSQARRDIGKYTAGHKNILNASYIKLRDITLAYELPEIINRKLRTDAISFRVQLSNIMIWKANKDDIDPEFHNPINGVRFVPLNQGTITFGTNIKF